MSCVKIRLIMNHNNNYYNKKAISTTVIIKIIYLKILLKKMNELNIWQSSKIILVEASLH